MGANVNDGAVAGGDSDIAQSFARDRLAYELLQNPKKARVYTAVIANEPVTHDDLTERIDGLSNTTIYNLLRELTETEYVAVDDSSEPYKYTARPVHTIVFDVGGDQPVFSITPTFIALVSASNVRDDLGLFIERHSLGLLAAAYRATIAYMNGEKSRRMAVDGLGLDTYEGITVTNEIESVIEEMRDYDPILKEVLEDEA